MKPKVLIDFHHEFLYEGLRMLFEDRLGYEVYRPIGIEWYKEKLWALSPDPKSADQLLSVGKQEVYGELGATERRSGDALRTAGMTLRYPSMDDGMIAPGIHKLKSSVFRNKAYRGITLSMFKSTKFDLLICSIPQHISIFNFLQKKFQPRSKVIFQIGNMWHLPNLDVKNILNSTTLTFPDHINQVRYAQEFDTNLFWNTETYIPKNMTAMMNYAMEPDTFFELEKRLPEWNTRFYGCGNRDGVAGPSANRIADIFTNEMGWLWHVKKERDGWGVNSFCAAATGRPLIIYGPYISGTSMASLVEHGKSAIDLSKVSIDEAAKTLKNMDQEQYSEYSHTIYNKFKGFVDYDQEEQKVRNFIANLK